MIYVMSDIHGCYDEFIEMLKLIKFSDNDTLYILGDVVDRGPEPIKVLDYIMCKNNIKLLLGNHEYMMSQYFKTKEYGVSSKVFKEVRDVWFRNGGNITIDKLGLCSKEKVNDYLKYIDNLEYFKVLQIEDEQFLLVHAGVYPYRTDSLKELLNNQTLDDLIWSRKSFIQSETKYPFKIIFGHTTNISTFKYVKECDIFYKSIRKGETLFEKGSANTMVYFNNKINIDCACCFGNSLGCLRLDDMKEFYINKK